MSTNSYVQRTMASYFYHGALRILEMFTLAVPKILLRIYRAKISLSRFTHDFLISLSLRSYIQKAENFSFLYLLVILF